MLQAGEWTGRPTRREMTSLKGIKEPSFDGILKI
jgi:hypothetical protein